jgi:AraC-like DNA-binding protein
MPLSYAIIILVLIVIAAIFTYLLSRKQEREQMAQINELLEKVTRLQQHEQMKHLANKNQRSSSESEEKEGRNSDSERFLAQVVTLANQLMPQGNATVETIAEAMHVSVSTFRRRIIAITGKSPKVFLLTICMNEAAEKLLTRPKEPLKIIAEECGFSEVGSFARTFKRVYGMTPTEYRTQAAKTFQQS